MGDKVMIAMIFLVLGPAFLIGVYLVARNRKPGQAQERLRREFASPEQRQSQTTQGQGLDGTRWTLERESTGTNKHKSTVTIWRAETRPHPWEFFILTREAAEHLMQVQHALTPEDRRRELHLLLCFITKHQLVEWPETVAIWDRLRPIEAGSATWRERFGLLASDPQAYKLITPELEQAMLSWIARGKHSKFFIIGAQGEVRVVSGNEHTQPQLDALVATGLEVVRARGSQWNTAF
jgi:hypothetical protein